MSDSIKNNYSLIDLIRLSIWVIRTKFIDRKVRLFRFPIVIRGRKYIDFGLSLTTGVGCRFDCFSGKDPSSKKLFFGKNVQINDYVHVVAMERITIGDNVLMASHVFISDNSHGSYKGDEKDANPMLSPAEREYALAPVVIGRNTWIGEGAIIMPGVTIGEGCVIGAHSVVSKDVPDFTVAVGSPAKAIKRFDFLDNRWKKI